MNRLRLMLAALVAAAMVTCTAVVPSANAALAIYASGYGPLPSGQSFVNLAIHETWDDIQAQSTGTAYSGVWITRFSGGSPYRASADKYCETPGCVAYEGWLGSRPVGYPTLHNHGNASPSYFNGSGNYY